MESTKNSKLDKNLYNAFWGKLQQLKYDIYYYNEHFKRCVAVSRGLKYAIVAITSLTTGAWINWNDKSTICLSCAIMIWLLQGISALSEWLPFEKRKQELRELSEEFDELYIEMESDWRKIQSLEVSNDEIRTMLQEYASKQNDICKHYLKDDALPMKEKIRKTADNLTEEYFKYFI